jgi:hypothetical protein
LQVTALPRNFETISLYYDKFTDISLLKEWGWQTQYQEQPSQTGSGWEAHFSTGGTVDVFNASFGDFEVALTASGMFDLDKGGFALTGTVGGKYTIVGGDETKNRLRLYFGATLEEDFQAFSSTPTAFGGVNLGGGLLWELDPFKKKDK